MNRDVFDQYSIRRFFSNLHTATGRWGEVESLDAPAAIPSGSTSQGMFQQPVTTFAHGASRF